MDMGSIWLCLSWHAWSNKQTGHTQFLMDITSKCSILGDDITAINMRRKHLNQKMWSKNQILLFNLKLKRIITHIWTHPKLKGLGRILAQRWHFIKTEPNIICAVLLLTRQIGRTRSPANRFKANITKFWLFWQPPPPPPPPENLFSKNVEKA